MTPTDLRALLEGVAQGRVALSEAEAQLRKLPFEDLGFARLDHHRPLRTGLPEVIYGPGKTPEQLARSFDAFRQANETAIATRVDPAKAEQAMALMSPGTQAWARYEAEPRLLHAGPALTVKARGYVAVASAGTSDRPVAEEAARTLEILGHTVRRITDVGVAGIHRLLAVRDELEQACVIIVVAGMEGALPSVLKGLVSPPVIAVPTSVGFGAHFQGLAPLLGMLSSCAPGVSVVNIDNGFGAACSAALIATQKEPVA